MSGERSPWGLGKAVSVGIRGDDEPGERGSGPKEEMQW